MSTVRRTSMALALLAFWHMVFGWAFVPLQPVVLAQDSPSDEEARLIGVLQSADASQHEKVLACKRLAVMGTEKSIPAIAKLLTDEKLSYYARFALEPMPAEAADEALRAALDQVQGRLLIGVVNSIGTRRDGKAIDRLAALVAGDDADLAAAAAAALGRVGTPPAAEKLLAALAAATGSERRGTVANGCLCCADVLFKQGDLPLAARVYDAVRSADLAEHIRAAGVRGAILVRGAEGIKLLGEQLQSENAAEFAVGLRVARESTDPAVTGLLCELCAKQAPERRAKLLRAAGDRRDKAALPTFLRFAEEGEPEVQLAAIAALDKLADPAATDVLLKVALSADAQVAQAARKCLTALPGTNVEQAILARLDGADKSQRLLAIVLVGERRMAAAVERLFQAAGESDPEIRAAAIRALGATVNLDQIPDLCNRLLAAAGQQEADAAKDALRLAAIRMADAEACAAKIAGQLQRAPLEPKVFFLELLRDIGGENALKAVAASAKDHDVAVQDAATRILGEWMSADAAPVLLDLATSAPNPQFQIRCLRGYIRIVRQLDVPTDERIVMCRKAMDAAQRDAERSLVLEALGRIPTPEALQVVAPYLDNSSLREPAADAVVAIAEKLLQEQPSQVIEPLKKVLQVSGNSELKVRANLFLKRAERAAGNP